MQYYTDLPNFPCTNVTMYGIIIFGFDFSDMSEEHYEFSFSTKCKIWDVYLQMFIFFSKIGFQHNLHFTTSVAVRA